MQKNIFITESQLNTFKDKSNLNKISPSLKELIDEVNSSIYDCLPPLKNNFNSLLLDGFEKSISDFKDDITKHSESEISDKLSKLITIVQKREQPILKQLEGLCEDIVSNFVKDKFEIECHLVTNIPNTRTFHISQDTDGNFEYESIEKFKDIDEAIKKRKILNALVMGCAMDLFNLVFEEKINKIFNLDEELPHLYSKILKINNYLSYISNNKISEKQHYQSAYVNVMLGKDSKIEARGLIFPFLLIETFRGVLEATIDESLLKDRTSCDIITSNADVLKDEPYYMTIGKTMWEKIYKVDNTKYILPLFKEFSDMDDKQFVDLFSEHNSNTTIGKKEMSDYVDSIINKSDYSDFEKNIEDRNSKQLLLLNNELDENELIEDTINEAVYPESFDIQYFKQLNSFTKRVAYCNKTLKKLGSGSSRIVYLIDENTVLKLAKNPKGIGQNEREVEISTSWYYKSFDIFADVYEYDEKYLWLEMQLARKAKKSDFKRILGIDFNMFIDFIQFTANHYLNYRYKRGFISPESETYFETHEFWEKMDGGDAQYAMLNDLYNMMLNEELKAYGDLKRISSWGVVNDTDGEKLVLIDFGLNDDVFNNFYKN